MDTCCVFLCFFYVEFMLKLNGKCHLYLKIIPTVLIQLFIEQIVVTRYHTMQMTISG